MTTPQRFNLCPAAKKRAKRYFMPRNQPVTRGYWFHIGSAQFYSPGILKGVRYPNGAEYYGNLTPPKGDRR